MERITEAYYSFITQYAAIRALLCLHSDSSLLPPVPLSEELVLPHGMVAHDPSIDTLVPVVCFMHLESILEDYLLQTLMLLYSADPQAIPDDRDETIRYSDVIAAKSREELIERIVYRAVRGVPRSLDRMITELRQFDIVLPRGDLALPFFVEMGATRNLWAHNGGRVDRQYLTKTDSYWRMLDEDPPGEGTQRNISPSYGDESIERALALVDLIERHLQERWPETGVRDVQELKVWERGRLYRFPEVSKDLIQALGALDLEVDSLSVSAFSPYLLGRDRVSVEEVKFSTHLILRDTSDPDRVGRMLVRMLEQFERVAAEHELRHNAGRITVLLEGRRDRELIEASFTQGELAVVRQKNLEGADLLDALGFASWFWQKE